MEHQTLIKAKELYDKKEYTDAILLYVKLAEGGNADAMYQMGEFYFYGHGVKKNRASAAEWYQRAADSGNADAQNKLDEITYHITKETQNKVRLNPLFGRVSKKERAGKAEKSRAEKKKEASKQEPLSEIASQVLEQTQQIFNKSGKKEPQEKRANQKGFTPFFHHLQDTAAKKSDAPAGNAAAAKKKKLSKEEKASNSYHAIRDNETCQMAAKVLCHRLNDDRVLSWLRDGGKRYFYLDALEYSANIRAYEEVNGKKSWHYIVSFIYTEHGYPAIPKGVIYKDEYINYLTGQIMENCPKVVMQMGNRHIILRDW